MKGEGLKIKGLFVALGLMVALMAMSCKVVHAEGVVIGGYDVVKIAKATLNNLKEKKVISDSEVKEFDAHLALQSSDPLVAGTSIIGLYSNLAKLLVDKNIATSKEIEDTKTAAAQSGGVKIGGVNPVVLAASYLDLLVKKGIITLPTAQSILDRSKISH